MATKEFTNILPMHHNGLNKMFTNHDWYKLVKANTMAKHGQNIGNRNNSLSVIGESLAERNIWKLWAAKMFKCIGKRLAVIGNQYFTNRYQYIITLVASVIIFWLIL